MAVAVGVDHDAVEHARGSLASACLQRCSGARRVADHPCTADSHRERKLVLSPGLPQTGRLETQLDEPWGRHERQIARNVVVGKRVGQRGDRDIRRRATPDSTTW